MIALKRVSRYLKGHFVNKLELDTDVDKHERRLDGISGSDWAGSTDRKSQSSGALFVDGAPLYSFTRRQSLIATSSGMAEFFAGCAIAEEMLLARDVLMFFCRDLQTRRRRESQIVASTKVVVTTGGQSENTHTHDNEIAGQLC